MSTHRITAGHSYTYLTRQTAAQDASVIQAGGIGAYYAEHGESPGRWMGSGLAGRGIEPGALVSEEQMLDLFGAGRHPDAMSIGRALRAECASDEVIEAACSLGAARLLGESTGTRADTLAKALQQLGAGERRLGPDSLVLFDEAGMASTPNLAKLVTHAIDAGASVRLVGDDRQLAAIGAGGILRDLAETTGAVTLATAVRFTDPDEAAAALGIRDGEAAALDFYLDAGRVHVGDEHTAADSAYLAWAADRAAGKDALLLAATREQVSALNARARADRIAAAGRLAGAELRLADGCAVSAGDAIVTRHNDRRLRISATDWVKNGDRWGVERVLDSGGLQVTHRDTARHVVLPAAYVAEHVALGYAVTIHAAQGRTADSCHTVITGSESREQLYVALSRGRGANHLHVALPGAADEHAPIRPATLVPPAAADLLRRVLDGQDAARSASSEIRRAGDPVTQLRDAVGRYADALTVAPAEHDAAPAGFAPLPWLPPVPQYRDHAWSEYLDARSARVNELAHEITDTVQARISRGAVLNVRDPYWQANDALWRATHPEDGPAELTQREQLYLRHLRDRRAAVRDGWHVDERRRWLPLVAAVDPGAVHRPEYPALAQALTAAFRARLDVDAMLPDLLHGRDYPRAVETLGEHIEERIAARQLRAAAAEAARSLTPAFRPQRWVVDPAQHDLYRSHDL